MPQNHGYRKQNQDYLKLVLQYSETISKRKLFMLDKDRKKIYKCCSYKIMIVANNNTEEQHNSMLECVFIFVYVWMGDKLEIVIIK